jgi:hypothetical protein
MWASVKKEGTLEHGQSTTCNGFSLSLSLPLSPLLIPSFLLTQRQLKKKKAMLIRPSPLAMK